MKGTIYKLDRTGHGEVASWGDDAASRAAGAAAFADLTAKGFTIFDPAAKVDGKLRAFDPDIAEMIAVPRMVGG